MGEVMGRTITKYLKQQQEIMQQMKQLAKSVNKSIAELAPWTPFERAEDVPELPDNIIFLNSRYQVNMRKVCCPPPFNDGIEISIKTRDRTPFHNWRDLQRIKNELIGPEIEVVELFPAESRLVDTANQYYLFAFPWNDFPGHKFPFGFTERFVSETSFRNSVQEPFPSDARPQDLETRDQFLARLKEAKEKGLIK
jgi:hypothetical protein